jgi:hypothetical protein
MMPVRFLIALFPILLAFSFPRQTATDPLFAEIQSMDSLVFQVAFNRCEVRILEDVLKEDLEFFHDKSGLTNGKQAFIQNFRSGLCNPKNTWTSRRELVSMDVFPLRKNGVLYGAFQTGIHRFFEKDKAGDGAERAGSTARFSHLWLLENGEWKLARVISYSHEK